LQTNAVIPFGINEIAAPAGQNPRGLVSGPGRLLGPHLRFSPTPTQLARCSALNSTHSTRQFQIPRPSRKRGRRAFYSRPWEFGWSERRSGERWQGCPAEFRMWRPWCHVTRMQRQPFLGEASHGINPENSTLPRESPLQGKSIHLRAGERKAGPDCPQWHPYCRARGGHPSRIPGRKQKFTMPGSP
jgi:hypothetical protein